MIKKTRGSYFDVEIHPDGRVIKTPRNRRGAEISQERLREIVRLQNQLAEMFPEVMPCKYLKETGQLETTEAPGEYGGQPNGHIHTMDFEMWREVALPRLNRVVANIHALGYVFSNDELTKNSQRKEPFRGDAKQRHNIKYDAKTDKLYLLDFHDIEYRGVSMKDKIVQLKNPRTGKYTKIDTETGMILAHKKSAGPYKGIKEILMITEDIPVPAPDKLPPGERKSSDPSRSWYGKKVRPVFK